MRLKHPRGPGRGGGGGRGRATSDGLTAQPCGSLTVRPAEPRGDRWDGPHTHGRSRRCSPLQPLPPLQRASFLRRGAGLQREPALCRHLSLCGGCGVAGSFLAFIRHSENEDGSATNAFSVSPVSLSRG